MRSIFLATSLLLTAVSTLYGQEAKSSDFYDQIGKYDFSDIWTLSEFHDGESKIIRQEPLGYIGDDYQRFFIHFISVIKNPNDHSTYHVFGKTKVKDNVCSFQGTIRITSSRIYEEPDVPNIKQGFIRGEYEFFEDSDQRGTGILNGTFQSNFYIGQNNQVQYDAFSFVADEYCNNQFEGKWTSYKSGGSKKCNWGDYRIPDSIDVDVGAGEFGPDEKYYKNGWENYVMSVMYDPKKPEVKLAKEKETEKWWLD